MTQTKTQQKRKYNTAYKRKWRENTPAGIASVAKQRIERRQKINEAIAKFNEKHGTSMSAL
jgi:hypothetical protein